MAKEAEPSLFNSQWMIPSLWAEMVPSDFIDNVPSSHWIPPDVISQPPILPPVWSIWKISLLSLNPYIPAPLFSEGPIYTPVNPGTSSRLS